MTGPTLCWIGGALMIVGAAGCFLSADASSSRLAFLLILVFGGFLLFYGVILVL